MTDDPIDYAELGSDLYSQQPDLMMMEVWRMASRTTPVVSDQHEIVAGYMQRRRQADDYKREQGQ